MNKSSNLQPDPLTCKDLYNLTRQFVRKYYETLHSKPELLWKFYDKSATLCHLEVDQHVTKYYVGLNQIRDQLSQSPHWDNCKIIVERIDHQPILIGVLVCVHGYMFAETNPGARFTQTFVLAKNGCDVYVVTNDILRFLPYKYQHPPGQHDQPPPPPYPPINRNTLEYGRPHDHPREHIPVHPHMRTHPPPDQSANHHHVNLSSHQVPPGISPRSHPQIHQINPGPPGIASSGPSMPISQRANQPHMNPHQPDSHVYNAGPNLSPVTRTDSPGHNLNATVVEHPNHPHHQNPLPAELSKPGEATSWSKVVSAGQEEERSTGSTQHAPHPHRVDKERNFSQMENKPRQSRGRSERQSNSESRHMPDRNRGRRNGEWEVEESRQRGNRRDDNRGHVQGKGRNYRGNNNRYENRGDHSHRTGNDNDRRYSNNRRNVDPDKEFFIRNLPEGLETPEVSEHLSQFGTVMKIDVRDRKMNDNSPSEIPSRYGFLTFSEVDSEALLAASPFNINNRPFSVERHKQPPNHYRNGGNNRYRNRNNGRGGRQRNKFNSKHEDNSSSSQTGV